MQPTEPAHDRRELLRTLPSISSLLSTGEVQEWLSGRPRGAVLFALQGAVEDARGGILSGKSTNGISIEALIAQAKALLDRRSTPSLRRTINATGIVLHTGLGRAPLSEAAVSAIVEGALGYCNLEYDLETGSRGHRVDHVSGMLASLTGAEAATVVNNNAAATFMILKTFAEGREVIVSRGQLVEIGGSFRLPDIMHASGAVLREVGTTNRTRIEDYERAALNPSVGLILRVHPSNYRVVGFTEEASIEQLIDLGRRRRIPVADDLGSGALFDMAPLGIPCEPFVRKSIELGADLACFSGDKLLGGPQCGVIVGKSDLIQRIEKNALMRTYRVDKLVLLALEATVRSCVDRKQAIAEIPTLAMLTTATDDLAKRAGYVAERLRTELPGETFLVCSDAGFVGGGSVPGHELETVVIQWRPSRGSAQEVVTQLRRSDPPVVARIRDDAVLLDLRTIFPADLHSLVESATGAGRRLQGLAEEKESLGR